MKSPLYTVKCNVLAELPLSNRFYMDMRVYKIVGPGVRVIRNGSQFLVWRGIYLAVEMKEIGSGR